MLLFYVAKGSNNHYKLEQIDGIAKAYVTDRKYNYILIATVPFADPITYFAVSGNNVFINQYMVNIVTETLKLRPSSISAPISLYRPNPLKVTYRSKLAVLADFTFIGPTFDEMKLKNIPINVNYKIDGNNVTETKSKWLSLNYVGQSDDFICEKFSGVVRHIEMTDCYRNHVYREYDLDIVTCETCDITRLGTNNNLMNRKPLSIVCIIPSMLYVINMSDGKCYLHVLVNKKQKITMLIMDKHIFYGDYTYHLSNKSTVTEYYEKYAK